MLQNDYIARDTPTVNDKLEIHLKTREIHHKTCIGDNLAAWCSYTPSVVFTTALIVRIDGSIPTLRRAR